MWDIYREIYHCAPVGQGFPFCFPFYKVIRGICRKIISLCPVSQGFPFRFSYFKVIQGHMRKNFLSVPHLSPKKGSGRAFFLYMPRNGKKLHLFPGLGLIWGTEEESFCICPIILQTARICSNLLRKVSGWRSAVGAYCKFNRCVV